MKKKIYHIVMLVITIVYMALGQDIFLYGSLPPTVTEKSIRAEYKRLWNILGDSNTISNRSIHVFYTTSKSNEQFSLPEWGGGGARGRDTIVVLLDKNSLVGKDVPQVTSHELVHIILARMAKGIHIPRWFHEGLAITLSGEERNTEGNILAEGLFFKEIVPLRDIEKVNLYGERKAQLCYEQSHSAIQYFIRYYGIDIFREIIKATQDKRDFWKGVEEVLYISEYEFEELYHKYLREYHSNILHLIGGPLLWGATVFVFLFAVVRSYYNRSRAIKNLALRDHREGRFSKDRKEKNIPFLSTYSVIYLPYEKLTVREDGISEVIYPLSEEYSLIIFSYDKMCYEERHIAMQSSCDGEIFGYIGSTHEDIKRVNMLLFEKNVINYFCKWHRTETNIYFSCNGAKIDELFETLHHWYGTKR